MKKTKLMFRDVVAQGRSKSRRIKNVDGYFFSRAVLMLRGTARKAGAVPEQSNCKGVMVMPERTGGKVKGACTVAQAARADADSPP